MRTALMFHGSPYQAMATAMAAYLKKRDKDISDRTVRTTLCQWCESYGWLTLTPEQKVEYDAWVDRNIIGGPALIQDALSLFTPQQREQILSGTHPECWEEMWEDVA